MALSSPGIGSSLDVNSIISQLMALESKPLAALAQKEASYLAKLTAYGSLKGSLSAFQNAVASLATPAKFAANKASVADSAVISASADNSAVAANYSITVNTLAQAQKLKSTTFASTATTVGSGKITIDFGTYSGDSFTLNPDKASKEITIASGQDSLAGIRDAINAENVGVTASIINDGTGYRLVLASSDSGVANALRITVDDDDLNDTDASGLSQLVFDGRTSGTKNLTETVSARNADLTIDGIAISKASNTITDAIDGVTLTLLKEGSSTSLSVARDSAGVKSAVEGFVKAFNDVNKMLKDLSSYNPETKQAAVLNGDATVRAIQAQLRSVLNSALSHAGGGLTSLSEIGVSFQKDGTLALDSAKLQKVIDDPKKDISTLFAAVGKPTDSLVSFVTSTTNTKAGSYAVEITRLATQAEAVGDVVLGGTTTITGGSNDTLTLTVDGVAASVTLAAGDYTPAELAAEIQSKINGASELSEAGIAVTVSLSGGMLKVTSDSYGSRSKVESIAGNAAAIFGTVDYANGTGLDVAGSIGGVVATGSGQILTGTNDASGLAIRITGGALGERGTVKFDRGYAYQLDSLIDDFLESDGTIANRTDGINRSIKDIEDRREVLTRRLEMVEQRLRAQFTALDVLMSSMTKTSEFLQQQLASLPKYSND